MQTLSSTQDRSAGAGLQICPLLAPSNFRDSTLGVVVVCPKRQTVSLRMLASRPSNDALGNILSSDSTLLVMEQPRYTRSRKEFKSCRRR